MNNEFYTVAELVDKLGLTDRTIRTKINKGEIKGYKKARKWYVLHSDLLEWVRQG